MRAPQVAPTRGQPRVHLVRPGAPLPEGFPLVMVWCTAKQLVVSPVLASRTEMQQATKDLAHWMSDPLPLRNPWLPCWELHLQALLDAAPLDRWWMLHLPSGSLHSFQLDRPATPPAGLQPAPVPAPGAWRTGPEISEAELAHWERWLEEAPSPLLDAPGAVCLGQVRISGSLHPVLGRGIHLQAARTSAVLEGLERQALGTARNLAATGSYRQLQQTQRVLDPATLVQPDPAGLPPHFQAWHPDLEVEWTSGTSLRWNGPILVPAQHVYLCSSEVPYVQETSSGVALGRCREEALLHALLELIERDAFLMTWYAQLPAPRIEHIEDPLFLELEQQALRQGFGVEAFDITRENGVPAVWVLLRNQQAGAAHVQTVSGAAAHLSPGKALQAALSEALVTLHCMAPAYRPELALQRVEQPHTVQDDLDHFLRFAHPRGAAELHFLGRTGRPWHQLRPFSEHHLDLREPLEALVQRLLHLHDDVAFVDLPAPAGCAVVRALVPGLLPMTFGPARRVDAPRLRRLQGRFPQPLAPHPFP